MEIYVNKADKWSYQCGTVGFAAACEPAFHLSTSFHFQSNFLLMSLGGSGRWRKCWVPTTHVGGRDGFSGSWHSPSHCIHLGSEWTRCCKTLPPSVSPFFYSSLSSPLPFLLLSLPPSFSLLASPSLHPPPPPPSLPAPPFKYKNKSLKT